MRINKNETIADIVEPCPYCGKGTAVEHVGYDNCFVVRCLHCGYTSGHIASEHGAIIRHNKLCREAAARRETCNFRTLSTKKYCFTWHGVSNCQPVDGKDTYFAPTMIDAVNQFIYNRLSEGLSLFKIDYWEEESNT